MTDFMSGKKAPYKDCSRQKRARLLRRLVDLISETVVHGCAGVMLPSGYRTLMRLHNNGEALLGDNAKAICADSGIGYISRRPMTLGQVAASPTPSKQAI
jgi:hypothetical protein